MVKISPGLTSSLFTGNLVWDRDDTPSNFSLLNFPKPSPLSANGRADALYLDLKAAQGKGWDKADITKATKQCILIPSNPTDLLHSVKNFHSASVVFTGENSFLSINLKKIHEDIAYHYTAYDNATAADKDFIGMFVTAIDKRINTWMNECWLKDNRIEVNDGMINFSRVLDEVKMGVFYCKMPETMKRLRAEDDDQNADKPKAKEQVKKVENPDVNPDWKLREGEDYHEVYGCKSNKPTVNNKPICVKWQIKGFCYSNCKQKEWHKRLTVQRTIDAMNRYLDTCRRAQ